jgi:hypothetical protein
MRLTETENQIQAAFFEWVSIHSKRHPELELFYAIPNGSHKSPAARGLFKRTGLKAGVPDVHLPYSPRPYTSGLWIEFKARNGILSSAQKWWIDKLTVGGYQVHVCRSWSEAANITIDYLKLPLEKI